MVVRATVLGSLGATARAVSTRARVTRERRRRAVNGGDRPRHAVAEAPPRSLDQQAGCLFEQGKLDCKGFMLISRVGSPRWQTPRVSVLLIIIVVFIS